MSPSLKLMITSLSSLVPAGRLARRLSRGLSVFALLCAFSGALLAQADPAAAGGDANGNNRRRQRGQDGQDGGQGRPNFDPAAMQERMLSQLRTRLDVTDDAEWKLISDKVLVVSDLRRASGGGFGGFGGFGGMRGGQGGQNNARAGRTSNPEADALNQAVQDKLPDAEIKSRLTRLREARKINDEKLAKAQEDLRAVLSVRQEATLVMIGLLP